MAIQIDRAIFLHIPKTGGTWVTNYFRETGLDHKHKELGLEAHIGANRVREIIGPTEDLCFCFVRHPLTWYRSFWEHRQHIPERTNPFLDPIVDLSFHEFLRSILQNHPGYLTKFFSGFTERCRFIGKQESLRTDLNNLLKYLRIPYDGNLIFSKPFENVVPSSQKYTTELSLAIMKAEEGLVKEYNYNYTPLGVIE